MLNFRKIGVKNILYFGKVIFGEVENVEKFKILAFREVFEFILGQEKLPNVDNVSEPVNGGDLILGSIDDL